MTARCAGEVGKENGAVNGGGTVHDNHLSILLRLYGEFSGNTQLSNLRELQPQVNSHEIAPAFILRSLRRRIGAICQPGQ